MFSNNLLKSGWVHALFIAIIAYPLGAVSQKFVVSYTDSNILVYTALFMLSSAIGLLFVAGPGELANQTVKRYETWIYGFLQIFSLIFFLLIIQYVSATEGAALGIGSSLFTLLLSILFLNQKTNKYEILGSLIILSGLYIIISSADLSVESKALLVLFVILRGVTQGTQKIVTEVHKTNRKAISFKSQLRVTGFIMAVASFVFLTFLLSVSFIKSSNNISFLKYFPNFSDFSDFNLFLIAGLHGLFIVSIAKYCEFYAGKTIGAKYLSSILSLHIIFVYSLELILANFDLVKEPIINMASGCALALILLGNFVISMAGFIKDFHFIKKGEKQDTLANLDGNFIDNEKDFNLLKLNMSNLLSLYDHNSKALSKDIKIDRIKLDNIANYDYGDLKIETILAKTVNDFASQHVSTKDKLTKAYNRYYLDHKADSLFKLRQGFKLYYLDLNKFKPINDRYGHDAGDYVLAETVSRLHELDAVKDHVFRVGGDEFVLVQTEHLDKDLTNIIIETIEQPISFEGNILKISTSIGITTSKEYDNLDDMIKNADSLMFKDKNYR
ncbi:MAG TPA: hypothetical protein DCL21_05240 [Alphaproteobacteria bacterium]|nr:hypothetical protein [Alphaproteobacteria bacterium]